MMGFRIHVLAYLLQLYLIFVSFFVFLFCFEGGACSTGMLFFCLAKVNKLFYQESEKLVVVKCILP